MDRAIAKWPGEASLQHARWVEGRLNVALYLGEHSDARDLAARQFSKFRRSHMHHAELLWRVLNVLDQRLALVEASDSAGSAHARALLSKAARFGRRLGKAREPYAAGWGLLLCAGAANLSGRVEDARGHLEAAEAQFTEAEMAAYVAVTKRRRGELIGGDEGRDLVAQGNEYLTGQGVRNPTAWSRMYAPGFD